MAGRPAPKSLIRAPRMTVGGLGLLLGLWLMMAFTQATAQDVDDRQQQSEGELEALKDRIAESEARRRALEEEREAISAALQDLQQKLVRAAQQIQSTEDRATHLENNVATLRQEMNVQEERLRHRHGQLSETLAAMQRLSRQPPALVFLQPEDSLTTIRSAALLSTVVPELRGRAEAIADDLRLMRELRAELEAERIRLKAELADLEAQRQSMDELIAARRHEQQQLGAEARAEAKRLQEYARQAKSLEALIARLEAEYAERKQVAEHAARTLTKRPEVKRPGADVAARPQPRPSSAPSRVQGAAGQSFASVKGSLPMPARGPVVRRFGERDELGNASKGIMIETRSAAQVVAPHDGQVVFAGPFRNYGQILIISHGDGYHTLLAGMSRISGVVGQWVLAGEPIGIMVDNDGSGGVNSRSRLYVELRSNGKPVNPLLWLAAGDGKVSG